MTWALWLGCSGGGTAPASQPAPAVQVAEPPTEAKSGTDPRPSPGAPPAPQPSSEVAPAPQPSSEAAPAPQPSSEAAPAPQSSSEAAPAPQSSSEAAPAPQSNSEAAPAPQRSSEAGSRPGSPSAALDAPSPADTRPRVVLIVGDSLAATDFGHLLEERLEADPRVKARRRGKSATGLARPDFFDWMAEAERLSARVEPDLTVVLIGGNDGQDLVPAEGRGRVRWGTEGWPSAYAERTASLATRLAREPEQRTLWIELPVMDRPRFEKKLETIRSAQQAGLDTVPSASVLPTRRWLLDGEALIRTVQVGRKEGPLRQEDGIHFSRIGARWFAERVAPAVLDHLFGAAD